MPDKKTTKTPEAIEVASPVATRPAKAPKPPKPAASVRAPVRLPKPAYVQFRNLLSQTLSASVFDDDGKAEEVRLLPNGTSRPVREDRITEHTKTLVEQKRLQVV